MSEFTFVIMSNDFPCAVFDNEVAADKYCEEQNEADKKRVDKENGMAARIYYRSYKFKMNEAGRIFN